MFRSLDDPNYGFVFLDFDSAEDAQEARRSVLDSGVLDRFVNKHGPNVVEERKRWSSGLAYGNPPRSRPPVLRFGLGWRLHGVESLVALPQVALRSPAGRSREPAVRRTVVVSNADGHESSPAAA